MIVVVMTCYDLLLFSCVKHPSGIYQALLAENRSC